MSLSDLNIHVDEEGLNVDGVDDVYPGISRNTVMISILVVVVIVGMFFMVKGVNLLMERRPRQRQEKKE